MRILAYYRRAFAIFLREPAFRALAVAALVVLAIGTVFYHHVEGWSWINALYFCTITLATIGYGDFTPTTEVARLFTIGYVLFGLGIVGAFLNLLIRAPMMMDEDIRTKLGMPEQALTSGLPSPPMSIPDLPPPPSRRRLRRRWRRLSQ